MAGSEPPAPPDPASSGRRSRGREEARKAIHLATVLVPVAVWFLPRGTALLLLSVAAVVAVAVEGGRFLLPAVRERFLAAFGPLLRPHEHQRVTGATWLALAYLAAVLLFPTPVAVAALGYAAVGDAAGSLVGRRWGRHRLPGGKTMEGSAAVLAACLVVGAVVPGLGVGAVVTGALAATLLEAAGLPPDDNVWICLGGGALLLV